MGYIKKYFNQIRSSAWTISLLFVAALVHYFDGDWTAFEWTTTQDIPALLRQLDPAYLTTDFYTNAIVQAPRKLYTNIITGLSRLTGSWYGVLYTLKLVIHLAVPVCLFGVYQGLLNRWRINPVHGRKKTTLTALMWLFSVYGGLLLQGKHRGPAGWGAIQGFDMLSPMTLSFLVGAIFMWMAVSNRRVGLAAVLAISTVMHPVIGLSWATIYLIFLCPISAKDELPAILRPLFIGVVVPISGFFFLSTGTSVLDAETFIQVYIHDRHPHHYLMSQALGEETIKWALLFMGPFIYVISNVRKSTLNRHTIQLLTLFVLAIFSLVGAILLQYLGTEVFQIKAIAVLGPSRFTAFTSLVWMGLILILYQRHYAAPTDPKDGSDSRSSLAIATPIAGGAFLVVLATLFCLTAQHPLDQKSGQSREPVLSWIQENTDTSDLFFVSEDFDAYWVRVFAQRPVFADRSFPFNESHILEFSRRYALMQSADALAHDLWVSQLDKDGVGYLVQSTSSHHTFSTAPVYTYKDWVVFKVSDLVRDYL